MLEHPTDRKGFSGNENGTLWFLQPQFSDMRVGEKLYRFPVINTTLEAMKRNAARYEWLRSQGTMASTIDRWLYETISDDCNPPYRAMKHGAELDAAIDKRMGEKQ